MSYPAILKRFHTAILDNNASIAKQDLTSGGHMDVYIHGYRERLIQAIRSDYPVLHSILGDTKFRPLAFHYIDNTPSQSVNLDRYPHNFAIFIKKHLHNTFACEVAELESLIAKTFMAEESKPLDTSAMTMLTPESFALIRLKPRIASSLAEFTYPVNDWLNRWNAGENPKTPALTPEYIYICRHNNNIHRQLLSEAEYRLLRQLCDGLSIQDALSHTFTTQKPQATEILTNIREWFAEWLKKGFFQIDS